MKKKVALVIGAGTSLGSAVARCFARDGLTAVVARRTGEELSTLKKEIEDSNKVFLKELGEILEKLF